MAQSSPESSATKRKLSESPSTSQSSGSSEATQRKRMKESYLQFSLTYEGRDALLSTEKPKRCPLLFNDITRLILECQFGSVSPASTRMCVIEGTKVEKSIILYIDNCPSLDNVTFPVHEKYSSLNFSLVSESHCSVDWKRELSFLSLVTSDWAALLEKYKNWKVPFLQEDDVLGHLSMIYPINLELSDDTVSRSQNDNFSRTHLLLSVPYMSHHNYPIPNRSREYTLTHRQYIRASGNSPIFSIDCEFVQTTKNGQELAEIAVINEDLEEVYYSLVKPENPVTNYLTPFSGITEARLQGVTTRLADVQDKLKSVLPNNSIIAGHGFECDMRVLKILHPYIADSSIYFNDSTNFNKRSKLKDLAKEYLNMDIQNDPQAGHSAVQDAKATMRLVKHKLSQDVTYGNRILSTSESKKAREFNKLASEKGQTLIFGEENSTRMFEQYIASIVKNKDIGEVNPTEDYNFDKVKCISVQSSSEVMEKICTSIPNADLFIGHLKFDSNEQFVNVLEKWEKELMSKLSEKTVIAFIFGNSDKSQPRACRVLV